MIWGYIYSINNTSTAVNMLISASSFMRSSASPWSKPASQLSIYAVCELQQLYSTTVQQYRSLLSIQAYDLLCCAQRKRRGARRLLSKASAAVGCPAAGGPNFPAVFLFFCPAKRISIFQWTPAGTPAVGPRGPPEFCPAKSKSEVELPGRRNCVYCGDIHNSVNPYYLLYFVRGCLQPEQPE